MALFPRGRWRRLAAGLLALAALLAALGLWLRPRAEARLRARILDEATRRGWQASVEQLRLGLFPLVSVRGARFSRPGADLRLERLSVPLRAGLLLGRVRVQLGRVEADGPAGLAVVLQPSSWELPLRPSAVRGRARLVEPAGLEAAWNDQGAFAGSREARLRLRLVELPAGQWLAVSREGRALVDPGTLTGEVELRHSTAETGLKLVLTAVGARSAPLAARESSTASEALGPPRDLTLELEGAWRSAEGRLEVRRWAVRSDGLSLNGSLRLVDLPADPRLEAHLDVEQLDFARVLRSVGLEAPQAVAAGDLGSAALDLRLAGRLADPASFEVKQQLDFKPPTRRLPALERLRGDFEHEAVGRDGARVRILVSPASPDFISIGQVPPLFVRALLISEDAGFWGHAGVDFSELPAALLTNLARGRPARGASTVTQQLAKNLFLSRDKAVGRKLQELCLALLLESALDKRRILEIYLNVIEWGPGLHGLRPAARHYFGREPAALSPAQMALLVALVPGPVKYQSSLEGGRPSGFLRGVMDTLLARLRSVEALDEDQYQAALAEDVVVAGAPEGAPASPLPEPAP